jgi:hypothetical protein
LPLDVLTFYLPFDEFVKLINKYLGVLVGVWKEGLKGQLTIEVRGRRVTYLSFCLMSSLVLSSM